MRVCWSKLSKRRCRGVHWSAVAWLCDGNYLCQKPHSVGGFVLAFSCPRELLDHADRFGIRLNPLDQPSYFFVSSADCLNVGLVSGKVEEALPMKNTLLAHLSRSKSIVK